MELFGTAGIRGPIDDRLTPELAMAVGAAAAQDGEEFVVGRDGRTSGGALAQAVSAGLTSGGARVRQAGVVPTPTLAFAARGRHGIMVTASHNPPADNGLKLFADGVEYDEAAEARIESRVAASEGRVAWNEWESIDRIDPLPTYRDAVEAYAREQTTSDDARHSPEPLTVAVDCGNGMAGLATPDVLSALDVEVVALEANVDGHFPARESKPTPETLTALRRFVADTDADLGIGHDGDADRIVVVDVDGEVVHEDTILAMLAEHFVRRSDHPDATVVTTPNASERVDERVSAVGGRVERVKLGSLHEGIANASGPVVFAGEPWKHVHPGLGGWIDGVASAAVLTQLFAVEPLEARRQRITERPYRKKSVSCPDAAKSAVMERLGTALPEAFPAASVDKEYGVRLSFDDGAWVLVRPSGTEPYVRVYAESETVDALTEKVREVVAGAVDAAE